MYIESHSKNKFGQGDQKVVRGFPIEIQWEKVARLSDHPENSSFFSG